MELRFFSRSNPDQQEVATVAPPVARPPLRSAKLERKPVDAAGDSYLAEYAELAGVIGVTPPDLVIESFKAFMLAHDLPIYSLPEVIKYMDDIAARESKQKAGWEWSPLRAKDNVHQMRFGRPCEQADGRYSPPRLGTPASDHYHGPSTVTRHFWTNSGNGGGESHSQTFDRQSEHKIYDRTIPLHAVRRVALIEREFKGDVAFFVSDYALQPEVKYPDPFLMAVIPNINVDNGTGRFVIDFWDEPGFGIDKMLK